MTTLFVVSNNSYYPDNGTSSSPIFITKSREKAKSMIVELENEKDCFLKLREQVNEKYRKMVADIIPHSATYIKIQYEQDCAIERIKPSLDKGFNADIDCKIYYNLEEVEFLEE